MDAQGSYAKDFGPFDGHHWMNTAHQGALPRAAVDAARSALEEKVRPHLLRDEDFFEVPRRLRGALAKLIGAAPDDIILGNSTSYGLDLLANGVRWQHGDEVLLVDGDFPADVFPWLMLRTRGVLVRFIKRQREGIDAGQLAAAISPRTRLFCTAWVNSFTGCAIDSDSIGEVCRDHRVIFVLNASQGLGARVLDVQKSPVDAITCCGSKWLCGPYATGFCWFTPSLRESMVPTHAYWLTMQAGDSLDKMRDYWLRTDLGARTWDVFCTANFLNFVPWRAAVEYLLQIGTRAIAQYDESLVSKLLENLDEDRFELISPRRGNQRSTLVVLRPRGAQQANVWLARLSACGFHVALREGNLRISPHIHNTGEEVSMLVNALSL